jgi:hypothetical protein
MDFRHSEQLNRLALRPNEKIYAGRHWSFKRWLRQLLWFL